MGLIFDTTPDPQRRVFAERAVYRLYRRSPDAERRYGPEGRQKCVEDMVSTLLYLEAAVSSDSPEMFRNYVAWMRNLFICLNIDLDDLTGALDALREIFAERGDMKLAEYLADALKHFDNMPDVPDSQLLDDNPLGSLAEDYLNRLLRGDQRSAADLILGAARSGVPLPSLYLHVLQPCLREIGRLWQINEITIAQEHHFTAATRTVMAQLSQYAFTRPGNGRRMIAACANGELHEVGMRMVADLFELDGWETTYLGASTPVRGVVKLIREMRPDLLAISVTIPPNLKNAAALVEAVRADPDIASTRILVGGAPFEHIPDLWKQIGADWCARDGAGALAWANGKVELLS